MTHKGVDKKSINSKPFLIKLNMDSQVLLITCLNNIYEYIDKLQFILDIVTDVLYSIT